MNDKPGPIKLFLLKQDPLVAAVLSGVIIWLALLGVISAFLIISFILSGAMKYV